MSYWHKTLKKRMATFPFGQRVLMIANEVNRAKNFSQVNQKEVHLALERALELLDFASVPSERFSRLKELRRIREITASVYLKPVISETELSGLLRILLQMHPEAFQTMTNSR